MTDSQRKRLEAAGWKFGSAEEFLGLTAEEAAFVKIKLALARTLRLRRERQRLSQEQVAKRLGSSQSRVAKMEAGDPSVSLDLLVHALLMLGVRPPTLGRVIGLGRPEHVRRPRPAA